MTPEEQAKKATSTELVSVQNELLAVADFVIQSDEDGEFMASALRDVKRRHKELEDKRTSITKPMHAAKKAVDDLFRPPKEFLERLEQAMKTKIADYLALSEEANVLALQNVADAETVEEANNALATMNNIAPPKGVSVRYKWRAEVFNPDIVPDEFRMPDERKIQAAAEDTARQRGEPLPIAGVRFHKEPIVTSRA